MTPFVLIEILGLQTYGNADAEGGLTGQETVKLHEQFKVNIVALWRLAVRGANVMGVKIDT